MSEKYVSPLIEELNLDTDQFGTGIIVAHDKKNKRVLLDVDISERLKISTSGLSMLLANGKYNFDKIKGDVQMNVNVWDTAFTKEELPKVKEHLAIKKQQAELKAQLKELQS